MSSTNISAPAPADDTGFLAQLLPNRGRVTFLRGLIRIFLAVGVLAGLSLIWDVYRDLHAPVRKIQKAFRGQPPQRSTPGIGWSTK